MAASHFVLLAQLRLKWRLCASRQLARGRHPRAARIHLRLASCTGLRRSKIGPSHWCPPATACPRHHRRSSRWSRRVVGHTGGSASRWSHARASQDGRRFREPVRRADADATLTSDVVAVHAGRPTGVRFSHHCLQKVPFCCRPKPADRVPLA